MKYRIIPLISILFITLCLAPVLSGQNILNPAKEATLQDDTIAAPILPIPVSKISDESNKSLNLVNKAGGDRPTEDEIKAITEEIDVLFSSIDTFLMDSLLQTFDGFNARDLDNTDNRASIYLNQISLEQSKLDKRYAGLEGTFNELDLTKKRWMITLEQSTGDEIQETLLGRINLSIRSIDSISTLLQGDLKILLLQQDRLLDRNSKLEALQGSIQTARLSLSVRMFSRDMPGFFKDLSGFGDSTLFQTHAMQMNKSAKSNLQVFRSEFSGTFTFIIILFVGLLIFLFWFKGHYSEVISAEKIEFTELHLKLIQAPFLVALFATCIIIRFAFPDLPYTIRAINFVFLIIPMVILTIRILGSDVKRWLLWLMAVAVLSVLYELFYFPDILQRIFLLFLSFAGLLLFLWMAVRRQGFSIFKRKSYYKLIRTAELISIFLLFMAVVANLVGAFSMAEFLTLVPIQIAFLALAVIIVTRFVEVIFYLMLASKFLLRVHAIEEYFDLIYKKISRFVNLFFWIFFAVMALKILRVKEVFFNWGHKAFTSGRTIGEVKISLQNILVFVFVIWLSLFITKLVRYILEKDVFTRISVSKGMPGTIIMLVRIVLITGGFFLAAAAAGMELTNLSIVLGAFSVGIGFGLQNIFNNMVSGLILAFERPINVGDTVQVGELMGTVLTIGLRASKIKSFDGAEVIVPNGNLISDSLINWTLSDAYRRMDIRVGVAYGTDPDLVMELMKELAESHELVRKEPPSRAYFLGFGDSSLDFRLLAWVDIGNRLGVESELNTSINARLKEAGIEIPFPQRDLHIRSDATKGKEKGPSV